MSEEATEFSEMESGEPIDEKCLQEHKKKRHHHHHVKKLRFLSTYAKLPLGEIGLYVVAWIGIYVWGMKKVYDLSVNFTAFARLEGYLTVRKDYFTSWPLMDLSDFEWQMWNQWLWRSIIYACTIHFFLIRIVERISEKHRFHASMIFSIVFSLYYFGWTGLSLLLSQSFVTFVVAFLTRSVKLTWLCNILLILPLSQNHTTEKLMKLFADEEDIFYLFICTYSMCNLRHMGFCLELCWQHREDTKRDDYNRKIDLASLVSEFVNLLMYQLYFPLFTGGPILTYRQYKLQAAKPIAEWSGRFALKFVLGMVRYGVWHVIVNWMLHYMYISVIHSSTSPADRAPLFTLFGLAVFHDQYFCVKYMVIYGLPAAICLADNVVVAGAPHCVSGKFTFSDMWKYFDKGLHKWLVRYVFVPLGGSNPGHGVWRKTLNTFVPFGFVYLWHGMNNSHALWAFLNAAGVYVENVTRELYNHKAVCEFEEKYSSPTRSRRACAFLSSFTYGLLIMSNLYFLSGMEVGHLYMKRIYTEDLWWTMQLHVVLYCGVQTSMELSRFGY